MWQVFLFSTPPCTSSHSHRSRRFRRSSASPRFPGGIRLGALPSGAPHAAQNALLCSYCDDDNMMAAAWLKLSGGHIAMLSGGHIAMCAEHHNMAILLYGMQNKLSRKVIFKCKYVKIALRIRLKINLAILFLSLFWPRKIG